MATPNRRRGGVSVDFTGVESGGKAVPDGEYLLECASCEEKESDNGVYFSWKWRVADGEAKGGIIYDNTSLQPQALWRLKGLLECMGIKADGKMSLNPEAYKGKFVRASVANEKYQGKDKPRIVGFLDKSASSEASGPVTTIKKGTTVKFEFEGAEMSGVVKSLDGDRVVVSVEIDGTTEEWELNISDIIQ